MACTGELDIDDGRGCARIARERLHVLHVNHHLRGEASDGDEAFVRDLCERLGLPLCVEHAHFADLDGRNLEAAARDVRYAAATCASSRGNPAHPAPRRASSPRTRRAIARRRSS